MDGILVIDKPAKWTSNDAVQKVKRTIGALKVGHLGTLDPMATGVLPLVINRATKFADSFNRGIKVYVADMKFGEATDTCDAEGRLVETGDVSGVKPEDAVKALKVFLGVIMQTPPMYSAIKIRGTPLYRLARKGLEVERAKREAVIYSMEVLRVSLPFARFRVACSRGTYVRSICAEAGLLLGCFAHMTGLRRMESSGFSIDEATAPDGNKDELVSRIIPLESALLRIGRFKDIRDCSLP